MAALDIVGHIRLADERRLAYLMATIRSIAPLARITGRFLLNIENGQGLTNALGALMRDAGFKEPAVSADTTASYRAGYVGLLRRASADYVMHFEEDHFCMLEEAAPITRLLDFARTCGADIIPLSFHRLYAERFAMLSPEVTDPSGRLFRWDLDTLWRVRQGAPPDRPPCFFVGTNALFSREFALAFWMRPISSGQPHTFELYDPPDGASLRLVLPSFEVLRPIDDDHGIEGSCCLHSREEKWTRLAREGLRGVGPFRRLAWRTVQARNRLVDLELREAEAWATQGNRWPLLRVAWHSPGHFVEAARILLPQSVVQVARGILRQVPPRWGLSRKRPFGSRVPISRSFDERKRTHNM